MEVIKANPESISEVFSKLYSVPEYQRPYSWDRDQCEKLWEDLTDSFNASQEAEYFLGTTVLIKGDKDERWAIIDGQQRLTTIHILMKALSLFHQYKALHRCVFIYDPITDEAIDDKLRIESNVIADDKDDLSTIIFEHDSECNKRFYENFNFFKEMIDNWRKSNPLDHNLLEKFITFLLTKVKLLPIDCGEHDNALRIFETLNNRGTPLNDADIFKGTIYKLLPTKEDKDEFIKWWKEHDDDDLIDYFRIYMHIHRAKRKDISNEINLRDYFTKNSSDNKTYPITKDNVKEVIIDIKKIIISDWFSDTEVDKLWFMVLKLFPSDLLIFYPYYVFMYKHGVFTEDEVSLSKEHLTVLQNMLTNLAKFIYARGVVFKTRNAIKFDIFKSCVDIYYKELSADIFPKITDEELANLKNSILSLYNRDKHTKGVLGLYHYLAPKQEEVELNKFQIEHILPREYQHYDGWDKPNYDKYIHSIGNLTLLEKSNNIKARNEYLQKKQNVAYSKSALVDVSDTKSGLMSLTEWTPELCQKRMDEMIERVMKFFK